MPGCDPVQPDFMIILKENVAIIHDRRIRGVPDLIVEVISPGSAAYDEGVKLEAYAKAGVPEYAVIDPAARKLRHYAAAKRRANMPTRANLAKATALSFTCLPDIVSERERPVCQCARYDILKHICLLSSSSSSFLG